MSRLNEFEAIPGSVSGSMDPGELLEMIMRSQDADPSETGQPGSSTVESQKSEAAEETRRKPIISIHGRDVDENEIDRVA